MNKLARTSGVAVSALTAATASVLLLMPGHPRLEYPEATVGVSGGTTVTQEATAPSGSGTQGGVLASAPARRLTASGSSSRSSAPAGDSPAPGRGQARPAWLLRPALLPPCVHPPVVTAQPSAARPIGDPGARCLPGYLWRRVVPDPHPCLTPATRAHAATAKPGHWPGKVPLEPGCASH
jgi:hypothetical protein